MVNGQWTVCEDGRLWSSICHLSLYPTQPPSEPPYGPMVSIKGANLQATCADDRGVSRQPTNDLSSAAVRS